MKKFIFVISSLLFAATAYAEPVIDVTKIAGKLQKEVAAYLGAPASCGKSKYGLKCQYKKGETEIIFIRGKADWITVEGIDHIPFNNSALAALGLKETQPSFKNNFTLKWSSIQGLKEVSIFKGSSSSDYAYIKAISN